VSKYIKRMPGEAGLLFTSNVSHNAKKMGLFSRSGTFTAMLTKNLNILNA
jgi:hypothetical protein